MAHIDSRDQPVFYCENFSLQFSPCCFECNKGKVVV